MKKEYSYEYLIYFLFILIFSLYFIYKSNLKIDFLKPKEKKIEYISPLEAYKWDKMTREIQDLILKYPGKVGVFLKDLKTNKTWTYNADERFPSASLIKVPIMIAFLSKAQRYKLDLNSELTLTNKDRRAGSGSLKWAREGTKISFMEILYKMITESDNTAAQMIIDYLGYDSLEKEFKNLGLKITNITPEGMSLSSNKVEKENYTTPIEMAFLFEKIYKKRAVSENLSENMLEILKRTKSKTRLKKSFPNWDIGHKTGLLRNACHDVAIVFAPKGDYLLAILTKDVPNYKSAKNLISKIGKVTSAYYGNEISYY